MAYSLSEIAEWVDGVVKGDASHQVTSIASLEKATQSDLAFTLILNMPILLLSPVLG